MLSDQQIDTTCVFDQTHNLCLAIPISVYFKLKTKCNIISFKDNQLVDYFNLLEMRMAPFS